MMRKLSLLFTAVPLLFALACARNDNANRPNANAPAGAATNANRPEGGAARSDSWVALKTKLALIASSPTSGYETDVDAKEGVVTLTGKVDTNEAKTEAEQVARKVEGVRNVNNQLQVVPEARRNEVNAADEKIKDAIGKLMDTDANLQSLSLSVDSNAGVVSLDGSVDTLDQLWKAAQAIRKVPGVKSVVTSGVTVREDTSA
ncbi:MAG TPA: BON domain-containing protein [Blastocatellia bacterium]|nr:BON domain-containing protein [Blastocatellia bacterium]